MAQDILSTTNQILDDNETMRERGRGLQMKRERKREGARQNASDKVTEAHRTTPAHDNDSIMEVRRMCYLKFQNCEGYF